VCTGVPCGRLSKGFGGSVVGMDGNWGWLAPSSGSTKRDQLSSGGSFRVPKH